MDGGSLHMCVAHTWFSYKAARVWKVRIKIYWKYMQCFGSLYHNLYILHTHIHRWSKIYVYRLFFFFFVAFCSLISLIAFYFCYTHTHIQGLFCSFVISNPKLFNSFLSSCFSRYENLFEFFPFHFLKRKRLERRQRWNIKGKQNKILKIYV